MKARVLTALALIPIVLGAVFFAHPGPLILILGLALALSLWELGPLLGQPRAYPVTGILAAAIGIALIPRIPWATLAAGLLILTSFGSIVALRASNRIQLELASLWIAAPLVSLLTLHRVPLPDVTWYFASPILLTLLPLWAGDTAAIFVGKAFGKHLLAPSISPGKTWEGGIANLLCAVGVGLGLAPLLGLPWLMCGLCGLWAGLFGQIGDLFESGLKRRHGLKDSGALLPGHGGLLDRIDSLLFTAPGVTLIIAVIAQGGTVR